MIGWEEGNRVKGDFDRFILRIWEGVLDVISDRGYRRMGIFEGV